MSRKTKFRNWFTLTSMLIVLVVLQWQVLTKYLLSIVMMLLVLRWVIVKIRERLGL